MSLDQLFWAAEASAVIAAEYDAEISRQNQWSIDRLVEWDRRFNNG